MLFKKGFGYAIDYDKEIAYDKSRIEFLSSEVCVRVSRELVPAAKALFPDCTYWDVYSLLTFSADGIAERAAIFGLTVDDVRAWSIIVANEDDPSVRDVLGAYQADDYTRGRAIDARFGDLCIYSEEQRVVALSKARADLARHTRNQAKHGASSASK